MVKRRSIPKHVGVGVRARDGDRCVFCGATDDLQLDHIEPHSLGGADSSDNLRILCGRCNRARGVSPTPDDATSRPPVALSCAGCDPHCEPVTFGYCMACHGYGEVPEETIDACPDPVRCGCAEVAKYRRRQVRRHRRAARRARS